MTRMHATLSPPAIKNVNVDPRKVCSLKVFVRKLDREILYAECNEDFVDSLLSFLVLPLELSCSLSNDNTILGCVGNLCRSPCRRAELIPKVGVFLIIIFALTTFCMIFSPISGV